MSPIHLGPIDPRDAYRKLVDEYFIDVQRRIQLRLSPAALSTQENYESVSEVLDAILEESVDKLHRLIPGAAVYWDGMHDEPPAYDTSPQVVVDVVDGTRDLRKGGTDVTSTFGVITHDGKMPLAVISYPFARERLVDFDGEVYRLPNRISDDPYFNLDNQGRYHLQRKREHDAFLRGLGR